MRLPSCKVTLFCHLDLLFNSHAHEDSMSYEGNTPDFPHLPALFHVSLRENVDYATERVNGEHVASYKGLQVI